MSTRGLVGCRLDGHMHACYNHMNSYPSWLGVRVVDFCKMIETDREMYADFKRKWAALEWINDDSDLPTAEQERKIMEAGFVLESKYLDNLQAQGINENQERDWYWLTRDFQGAETFVAALKGWPCLVEYSSFIESTSCEYAYILDLDRGVLEFYASHKRVNEGEPGYDEIDAVVNNTEWVRLEEDGRSGYKEVPCKPYKYSPCLKVGERVIDQLDDWRELFPDERFDDVN